MYFYSGVDKRFAETIFMLCADYGWKRAWRPERRMNSRRPATQDLDRSVLRQIEKITEHDRALYDKYRIQLEDRFAEIDFGEIVDRFKSDLYKVEFDELPLEITEFMARCAQEIYRLRGQLEVQTQLIAALEETIGNLKNQFGGAP